MVARYQVSLATAVKRDLVACQLFLRRLLLSGFLARLLFLDMFRQRYNVCGLVGWKEEEEDLSFGPWLKPRSSQSASQSISPIVQRTVFAMLLGFVEPAYMRKLRRRRHRRQLTLSTIRLYCALDRVPAYWRRRELFSCVWLDGWMTGWLDQNLQVSPLQSGARDHDKQPKEPNEGTNEPSQSASQPAVHMHLKTRQNILVRSQSFLQATKQASSLARFPFCLPSLIMIAAAASSS